MPKPNGDLQQNPRCMDAGSVRGGVHQSADDLGHTQLMVANYGDAARHFAEWLALRPSARPWPTTSAASVASGRVHGGSDWQAQ